MTDFLVKKDDFRECRVADGRSPEPGRGQALLRVDTFGMTANNVTYAVFGEAMSYWDFFPTAEDGWGRLPTWGFAEVESSEADGVEPGTRLYGYLPSSSHLLVTPADADGSGFVDGAPHKAALPSAYHRYLASGADPFYRAETEAIQMLLRPLFFTSFLIDDQLDDEGLATRGPVIVSSASSKTSIAAAFLLAQREDVELVGLTGAATPSSSRGWGSTTAPSPTTRSTRSSAGPPPTSTSPATARCARPSTRTSATSSSTAWRSAPPTGRRWAPARATCRPDAELLLRPDQGRQALRGLGPRGLETRVADAWHPFCEWIDGWLETIPGEGFDAVQDAWVDVLEGRVEPKQGPRPLAWARPGGSGGEPALLLGADRRRRQEAAEPAAHRLQARVVAGGQQGGELAVLARDPALPEDRGERASSSSELATVVRAISSPETATRSSAG